MKPTFTVVLLAVLLTVAQAAIPPLGLKPIVTGQLQSPTSVANAGDGSGRLFICEQRGQIRIIQNGMLLPQPFLNITAKLVPEQAGFDERGLLGLAFHPGYANAASAGYRKFYIFYSAPSPTPSTPTAPVNCRSVIAEYQVSAANPNLADAASERILLSFDKPQFNHNGGQLEFGPDGLLYISTGDGGSSNDNNAGHTGGSSARPNGVLGNAQDRTRLMGKILRIDPLGTNGPGGQYGIPAANPFVGAGGGIREEIYAFGLRNPWRFSFDVGPGGTNRLFCADVGQGLVEEVNLITAGGNYGWRIKEGSFDFDATAPNGGTTPVIPPIAQYAHPGTVIGSPPLQQIGVSVTGGYVYRGTAIAGLAGKYVFADWGQGIASATGTLLGLEETSPGVFALSVVNLLGGNPIATHIAAFGRDEQGELYVATKVTTAVSDGLTGAIYKIVAAEQTVDLISARDSTLFSEMDFERADGIGDLYVGRIGEIAGPANRRALIFFDLSAIPTTATLQTAEVRLNVFKTAPGATPALTGLHRLTESWGENTTDYASGANGGAGLPAQDGDATWLSRFYNFADPPASILWANAGGTFNPAPSASISMTAVNTTYTWTSTNLRNDIQNWLASPATNHGWLVLGNEDSMSARRIDSRETARPGALPPRLRLTYLGPPVLTRRESWLQTYFPPGQFVDDAGDLDGDGFSNGLEYALAFSPVAGNPAGSGVTSSFAPALTLTFRRDPRATDLTYRVEISPDLVIWTPIATSTGGAKPSGNGFLVETDIAGEAPLKLVTARDPIPAGSPNRFIRLKIIRQL